MDKRLEREPDIETVAAMVFEAAIEAGSPIVDALSTAIGRYPAAAAFLTDYAGTYVSLQGMEESTEIAFFEAQIIEKGDKLLASRLSSSPPRETVLTGGLIESAKRLGLTIASLSDKLGLARSVIVKVDRRLIELSTIPDAALARIATALDASTADLRAYLGQPPTLSASASYKSADKPTVEQASGAAKQSFTDALDAAISSGEMDHAGAASWRAHGLEDFD